MAGSLTPRTAAERFLAAAVVKTNPVREVRRDDEFFYKLDRRGGHALRCEFAAAALLTRRHIPVVEHLWCGKTRLGEMLVTRALPDAPTVREYARGHVPDAGFRDDFADFIRAYLASGLDHLDMHIGNILYDTRGKRFVLVDVRAVRRWRWRRFPYDICRAPLELRRDLSKAEVCTMLARIGLPDPEAFYDRALYIEAKALCKDWPKRRAQILAGYPKFTRREDGLLVAASASKEELENARYLPGDEEDFCRSFYWELAEIPCRRALIWDLSNGRIGYGSDVVSRLSEAELAERRRIFAPPASAPGTP